MEKEKRKNISVVLKIILWFFIFVLLLFLFVSLVAQIPLVQKKIVDYANTQIIENTSYSSSIGHVTIDWFDKIHCSDIQIKDKQDSSLISVKDIFLNFDLINIIQNKKVILDNVILKGAEVRLILEDANSDVNIYHFVQQIIGKFSVNSDVKESVSEGKESVFLIKNIRIEESYFSFHSLSDSLITKGYDYYHFGIKKINGDISHFSFQQDSLVIEVKNLNAVDANHILRVENITTRFVLGDHFMKFDNLSLKTGKSFVTDFVIFRFERAGNMAKFVDSVQFEGHFKNSVINIDELRMFATGLDSVFGEYILSGNVLGKVGDFVVNADALSFGNKSVLRGIFQFKGLPDYHTMSMNLQFFPSHILLSDVSPYYSIQTPYMTRLSFLDFYGNMRLTPKELFVKSVFSSSLGSGRASFTLGFQKDKHTTYTGSLGLSNFELGKYLGLDSIVQKITLEEDIVFEGSGFDTKTLHCKWETKISDISLLDKRVQHIRVKGEINPDLVKAIIDASDSNIVLHLRADFETKKEHLTIKSNIQKLPFTFLGITHTEGHLQTQLLWNTYGTNLNEMTGDVTLHETFFAKKEKQYSIKEIAMRSFYEKKGKHVEITSDMGYIKAHGNFSFDTLLMSVAEDIRQYKYALTNKEWDESPSSFFVDTLSVEAEIKEATPFFEFLETPLIASGKTKLFVRYKKKYFSQIDFSFQGDTIEYKDMVFAKSDVEWKSVKESGKLPVFSHVKATLENYSHKYIKTHNSTFDIVWKNDNIAVTILAEDEKKNRVRLLGEMRLFTDSSIFSIKSFDSALVLGNNIWSFLPHSQIIFDKNGIFFEKFEMQAKGQKISILGYLKDNISYPNIFVNNFSLENFYTLQPFHSLVENKIKGIVNGEISIHKKGNTHQLHISHEIKNALVNDSLLGDIKTYSYMGMNSDTLYTEIILHKNKTNIIFGEGYTVLSDTISPLHFTANIHSIPLKIGEFFGGEYVHNVEGMIDGKISITGQYNNPIFNGSGEVFDGKALLQYPQTYYQFSGKYSIEENKIRSNGIKITDVFNNTGYLDGYIEIKEYNNLWVDISARVNNFQVLNTTIKENPLYYGSVYATGDIHFLGNMDEMKLSVHAASNPNTNIHFSMSDNRGEEVVLENFIEFVAPKKNEKEKTLPINKIQTQGSKKEEGMKFLIELDMEINTNALCEIIFNNSSGDIIKGRGNGKLKLSVNSSNDVALQGDLEIEEGSYNFTLFNIISKEFSIQKGGKMSWTHDIYGGTMNINALYQQYVSLTPILTLRDSSLLKSSEITRKYPTIVNLNLSGPILHPEMKFDIDIKDYPSQITLSNGSSYSLNTEILAFKETIKRNEVELGKQVFSLLVLKSFASSQQQTVFQNTSNQYSSMGSATINEFFSNQLNYWISYVNPNLEVDLDISSISADVYKNAQLRLGYSLLDKQLKIVREGSVYDNSNQNQINTAIGNWIIEYKPSQIENMKLKMYYRQNNSDNILNNSNTGRSGFSIQYINDFDITIPKKKK